MLRASDVVTESEPNLLSLKTLVTVVISLLVLGFASYYVYGLYQTKTSNCALRTKSINPISNCIKFERAETKEARTKGLSGRNSLAQNEALLFVFDSAARQCMWMKDMNFNIDIVWLDKDKTITKVSRDISPETYPNNFCGGDKDLYVIETAASAIDDNQLKVGNKLNF